MPTPITIILAAVGGSAVISALDGVRGALGGLAATALGTTSALAGVSQGLALGGELNDLSARTGQAVRDLVILRRALDNAGVGGANAAQYIGLLQKAIAGLNEEGGQTGGAFKRLGLDADRLKKLGVKEQIDALTAGFAKILNPSERAAIAMQLFGRSGAQMLQLLGDSSAMTIAGREASRLADRLQRDNAAFDELGDRLSIAKLRLQEFWVVAAEKAVPMLTKMADVLEKIDPGPYAAAAGNAAGIGLTIAGVAAAQKASTVVAGWANSPVFAGAGAAAATKFFGGFSTFISKAGWWALASLVGYNIGAGMANWWKARKQAPIDQARSGDADVTSALEQAGKIASETERMAALEKLLALQRGIVAARAEEATKTFASQEALGLYDQQLLAILSTVDALTSKWGAQQMAHNQAAAAAQRFRDALAEQKKFEEETLTLEERRARAQKELAAAEAANSARIGSLASKLAGGGSQDDTDRAVAVDANLRIAQAKETIRKIDVDLAQKASEAARDQAELARLTAQIVQLQIELKPLAEQRSGAAQRLADAEAKYLTLARTEKENSKVLKEADIARLEAKRALLTIDEQLAQRAAEQARNALEAAQLEVQRKVSALDADFARTDADKWSERKKLLEDAVKGAKDYLKAAQAIRDANPNDSQAQSNVLSAQQGVVSAGSSLAALGPNPDSFFEQMQSNMAQLRASWGTMAQSMGQAIAGAFDSARNVTSDFLYNIGSGAMTMRQAWNSAVLSIGQSFLRMITDMVAKMIWRATVERALIALGVVAHTTGETVKTTATVAGSGIRLGTMIKEALADVYHGAIAAFKALAGIPYVGPFLAGAAMAAALAGGIALVGKIGGHEAGGLVRGGRQLSWLNESGESEFVWSAPAVKALGPDRLAAMHDAARGGNLAAVASAMGGGDDASGGGSGMSGAAGGRPVHIYPIMGSDEAAMEAAQRNPNADAHFIHMLKKHRRVIGMKV